MAFQEFTGELDQQATSGPVQEFTGDLDTSVDSPEVQQPSTPEPTMGQVAMNAIPKGAANLLNTPMTLRNLLIRGLASLPALDHAPDVRDFLNGVVENQNFGRNYPMEAARSMGAVSPAHEPQTESQRIVDAAIQGAVSSALIPVGGVAQTAKNIGMGALSGTTAQTTKELTGSDLLAGIVGVATSLGPSVASNMMPSRNKKLLVTETGKDAIQKGIDMGFTVEPSKVRAGSSLKETVAGKAAIAQATIEHNQPVTNKWAAVDIGLPAEAGNKLTPELLDSYKKVVIKPYQEVDQALAQAKQAGTLPWFPRYHSPSLTHEYIEAGQTVNALWKTYWQNPDIKIRDAAKAAEARMASISDDIEQVAQHIGDPKLMERVRNAKMLYAKVSDVEAAMNPGSGNVSLEALGKLKEAGKKLSGKLEDMANFALNAPRSSKPIEKIPPSGVSGTDAALMSSNLSSGTPQSLFSLGIPGLREAAKKSLLSDQYQQSLLTPAVPKANMPPVKLRSLILGSGQASGESTNQKKERK